jgi:hypothetical protein
MSHHNVNCPKGYGEITFVGVNMMYCPVSTASSCVECEVIPFRELGDTFQVKKVPAKK